MIRPMRADVFYRRPANATPVALRSQRPGRPKRYHQGARIGDGPLLMPEACNLDQANHLVEVPDDEVESADTRERCRRCYPERAAVAA